jgi:phenylpyruvate tautomerase PptA (4-oxalocrotonate tautomerase family)
MINKHCSDRDAVSRDIEQAAELSLKTSTTAPDRSTIKTVDRTKRDTTSSRTGVVGLRSNMPIYSCTLKEGTVPADTKQELAVEIGAIHSAINHVPSNYVNVVFNELPSDSVYTDGVPARPFLVNGWVREGHPKAETTRLATEIAAAITRITRIPAERVLVVFQSSPASFAVEGGRVLPEPGDEEAWVADA